MRLINTFEQRLDLSLHVVQTAAYARLNIVDMIRPHWILSHVLQGEVQTSTCGAAFVARAGDVMLHVSASAVFRVGNRRGNASMDGPLMLLSETRRELFRLYPVCPVVRLHDAGAYAAAFARLEPLCAGQAPPPDRLQAVSTPGTEYARLPAAPSSACGELQILALASELFAQVLDGWQRAGSPPRPLALQSAPDIAFRKFWRTCNAFARETDAGRSGPSRASASRLL